MGQKKTYKVLHMINFEPFTTESHCLHQNAQQRLPSIRNLRMGKYSLTNC